NRALFPGWLIAPYKIREHLWMFTRYWIPEILRVLPEFTLDERLVVLGQLNWRMETALIPLWANLAPAVAEGLERINPFPGEMVLPQAELILSRDNLDQKKPGWEVIRKAWLELAFGVLRFHREERHRSDFERWSERLDRITESLSMADGRSRLCYERCLYA